MTDRCDDLHAYVDGELGDTEAAAFESHLLSCDTCNAELPRLLVLLAALDDAAALAATTPARTPHLSLVTDRSPGHGPAADQGTFPVASPEAAPPDEASSDKAASERRDPDGDKPRAASPAERARARRRRWPLAGGLVAAMAAAAVVLLVVVPASRRPELSLEGATGATRPIEARLSYRGATDYRPQNSQRAAGTSSIASDRLLQLELAFEQAKDWHGVAVASLLAGDQERARQAFARAPATPEVDADRAALELMNGKPDALERALDDVDRALAAAPGNATAHWNRALVLAAMNLPLAAAKEFDAIQALGEPGWSSEARTRRDALRAQVVQRRAHWKKAYDAGRRLIEDGTPVPADVVDVTGVMTIMLYDAARAAPSPERVLALLPLASTLDGAYRNTRLTSYVRRIATSDFRVRKPLADSYREVALGRATPAAKDALLAQLARGGADDIRLGAMVFAGRVGAQLDDYRRLAAQADDPWLTLISEQETAAAETARNDTVAAERRLRDAIALAQREHMVYRAVRLEIDLVKLYKSTLKLSLAAGEAAAAYRGAITAGEWQPEISALSDLASIYHNRYAYGLARAYLTELAERADAGLTSGVNTAMDCLNRMYAYGSLANLSVLQRDPERARAELAQVMTCDKQAKSDVQAVQALRNALVRSELYRFGHRAEDARLARDSLAALRNLPSIGGTGKDALLAYIDGSLAIKDDPAAGRRALRDAIATAGHQTDELSIKARAYSLSLLAVEAGSTAAFDEVISVMAETLNVHEPKRCAVAITVDGDRAVVAFRDAGGATGGQYTAARKPGPLDVTTLVPTGAIDRLRPCEHIAVLARAPVLGAGRLLPAELAWSYQLTDPAPSPPAQNPGARRLVVANPETPPELNLPALGPYPDEPSSDSVVILRGASATPGRVRLAMQDASVVEFHTHGLLADDLFEASHLVLSPEPDRQYELTPSDVAQVHLAASPLVILGACHAATSSRVLEGGLGLAEAFLRAGARAVIASPDAVQDLGAYALFAAVRDRVLRGTDPAIALRDERMHRLAASHDDTWVSGVVVFQ